MSFLIIDENNVCIEKVKAPNQYDVYRNIIIETLAEDDAITIGDIIKALPAIREINMIEEGNAMDKIKNISNILTKLSDHDVDKLFRNMFENNISVVDSES